MSESGQQKAIDEKERAEDVQDTSQPVDIHYKSSFDYLKSRFDKKNWFGSLIILAYISRGYSFLMAGLTRQIDGKRQPDHMRAVSNGLSILANSWSFFSTRGGEFPAGDTFLARIGNSLKHPNRSSTQFEYLALLPAALIGTYNSFERGLKAYGVGLKPGEKAYAAEKIRLYHGLASLVSVLTAGYGHFRTKKEVNVVPAADEHPPGFRGMMSKLWKHDKVLVTGGVLNTTLPLFQAFEAWKKAGGSRKEARHLIAGALTGTFITSLYNIYIFQRIARSNFEEKKKAPVPQPALPENDETGATPEEKKDGRYVERIVSARNNTPASVVQTGV